jgi:hypothetical protein
MNKLLLLIPAAILAFSGCEKYTYPELQVDPSYPTVILKPDVSKIDQMRFAFRSRNIYLQSSLDDFGFTNWGPDVIDAPSSAPDTTVTRAEAIDIAKKFLLKNSLYTGVNDTSAVNISEAYIISSNGTDTKSWVVRIATQKVDSIELKTYLLLHIKNREVSICLGNWYPEVYIPLKFNFTAGKAKSTLLGKVLTHWGWSGPFDVKVTQDGLDRSTVRLMIRPETRSDRIELRVVWEIDVPDVWYKLSVDVMTGELISAEPTIVF